MKAHEINKQVVLIELTLTCELFALFCVLVLYLISTCFLLEDSVGGGVCDEFLRASGGVKMCRMALS